jgi:hypothetical protein
VRRILLALAFVVCRAVAAQAATYYVDDGGSAVVNCAAAQVIGTPRSTINNILSNCAPVAGDTIFVRTGTYNERIANPNITGSVGNILTIAAYPGTCETNACEVVTLKPTSGSDVILALTDNQSYITFDGIDFDTTGGTSNNTAIHLWADASSNPHHIQFRNGNCVLGGNGLTSEGSGNGVYCHIFVDDRAAGATGVNSITNWTSTGGGDAGDYVYCAYIQINDTTVTNYDCDDTQGIGFQVYNSNLGGQPERVILNRVRVHGVTAIAALPSTTGIIMAGDDNECWNCIVDNIVDGGGDAIGIFIYSGSDGIKIYNSNIYNVDGSAIFAWTGAVNAEVKNTITYGNNSNAITNASGGAAPTSSTNLLGTNPVWANPAAGDFTISASSPAYQTGATLASVTIDYAGISRPQDGLYEIGAYESGGGPPPATTPYYVDGTGGDGPGGNDANTCEQARSITTAKRTLSGFFNECGLNPGDTLLVRGGTYDDRIQNPNITGAAGNLVKIHAYPGDCSTNTCETVTVKPTTGANAAIEFSGSQSYIELDGIDCDSSGGMTANVCFRMDAWASGDPHHMRFLNGSCLVGGNGVGEGTSASSYCFLLVDDKVGGATGTHYFSNWEMDISGADVGDLAYCMYIQTKHVIADDVHCYNMRSIGLQVYNSNAGGAPRDIVFTRLRIHAVAEEAGYNSAGLYVAGDDVFCINCIIYDINDAGNDGAGILIDAGSDRVDIYNSNFYQVDGNPIVATAQTDVVVLKNVLSYGNFNNNYVDAGVYTPFSVTTSLFGTDPLWTSPPFTIPITSPARNTGTNLGTVLVDFENRARPQEATTDIGAYEYIPVVASGPKRLLLLFGGI